MKGLCGRCLSEFIDWRCNQPYWYFRPSFVNWGPSNLLSGLTPPPFHVMKYSIYRHCVTGRGWRVLKPVEDHILQEFNILCLSGFRTHKIADHPKQKPRRERGPEADKHLPQSPFTGKFLQVTTFCFGVYFIISPW